MWSKKVAKESQLHTANVWGRMVALRMYWRRNQEAKAWWFCLYSPSAGDVGNCPLCLYLKFTLWLPPNISGLDFLNIHDFNYISNKNKNNKIDPQSLVSSAVIYTYFCVILETIRFKIACPAAIGTDAKKTLCPYVWTTSWALMMLKCGRKVTPKLYNSSNIKQT